MPELPPAIARYFATEAGTSADVLAACFAPDAVVRDEAREHRGLIAITAWRQATQAATPFTTQVLSWHEREGRILVATEIAGQFPGSPIALRQEFTLEQGRIAALAIG